MPILKNFLCCCSLRTGSLVAGFAGIILSIVGIIVIWTARIQVKTIVLDWLPSDVVRIIITINFAMTVFISLLLIAGIIKRNMFLMIPWVLLGIMLAIGLLVSIIYTSVKLLTDEKPHVIAGVLWLVLGLIAVVVYLYMWLVVYSFFTIIKEETDRGAYKKAPFRRHY